MDIVTKFRAWNRETKDFTYPDSLKEINQLRKNPKFVVQQSTGFRNKKNGELWEGDKIKVDGLLYTLQNWFGIGFVWDNEEVGELFGYLNTRMAYDFDILGNEIDNYK